MDSYWIKRNWQICGTLSDESLCDCIILELSTLKYIAYRAENDTKVLWSFMRSQRGAPFLIHSGYVFRCERQIGKKTYWLCLQYKRTKCNARLILDGNSISKSTEHNHRSDPKASYSNIEYKNLEDDDVETWIKSKWLK